MNNCRIEIDYDDYNVTKVVQILGSKIHLMASKLVCFKIKEFPLDMAISYDLIHCRAWFVLIAAWIDFYKLVYQLMKFHVRR